MWGSSATCCILSLAHHQRLFVPICSEPTQRPRTVCERWRENLLEHYGGTPRDDQYVPQCDDLGHFIPLQCHGKSDFCWCVDKDGREVQGTRSQPGTTPACKQPRDHPHSPQLLRGLAGGQLPAVGEGGEMGGHQVR